MFLHRLGASADAFAQPVQFASSVINGISHCHLASVFGLPRLRPHTADLLHRARAAGLTTSVDTQWDTRGRWMEDLAPCLSATDLLFMNEDEARMLTGSPDPATAAKKMREQVGTPLSADDIARVILYIVSQPEHVAVNEVLIRPTRQSR